MKIENFKDLKLFVNSLLEEELNQPVLFWSEEESGEIFKAEILEEDFINASGEGLEPRSAYQDDEDYDDEPTVLQKGTAILSIKKH